MSVSVKPKQIEMKFDVWCLEKKIMFRCDIFMAVGGYLEEKKEKLPSTFSRKVNFI